MRAANNELSAKCGPVRILLTRVGESATAMPNMQRDLPWDLRTADLNRVRREIGRLLKPFDLSARTQKRYDARLIHRRLGRSAVTLIDYGGAVAIDAGVMSRYYLLQVPLEGSYTLGFSGRTVEVPTRCAHVIHPGMPLEMNWSPDCRVLVLSFEAGMLAPQVAANHCPALLPEHGDVIRLDSQPNEALGCLIDYVTAEAFGGDLFARVPQAAARAESLLVDAILDRFASCGAPHEADRRFRDAVPEYVARAEEYVLEHLVECVTIAGIANAASVPTRTLFEGFRRARGVSPLAWMRAQRLDRVRAELLGAHPGSVRITEVAMHWGFAHLGRFCVAYRNRFGETPRETLRHRHQSGRH
jgi:AraC-like DNA-binding protein